MSSILIKLINKTTLVVVVLSVLFLFRAMQSSEYDVRMHEKAVYYTTNKSGYMNDADVCGVFNCSSITGGGVRLLFDKGLIVGSQSVSDDMLFTLSNYYVTYSGAIGVKLLDGRLVEVKALGDVHKVVYLGLIDVPLAVITFFIIAYTLMRDERIYGIVQKGNLQGTLEYRTMNSIAEDTAHEVRTPLDTIVSKVASVRQVVEEVEATGEADKLGKLKSDFNVINMSVKMISRQMDKMHNYKRIKHGTDSLCLYEIAKHAAESIDMNYDNVNIQVDEELRGINPIGLHDTDVLGILICNMNNSVYAKAANVAITLGKRDTRRGLVTMVVEDDGEGIPRDVISKVFHPNFSTKDDTGDINGNGLFVSKQVIEASGGTIRVVDSDYTGTVFAITIKCKV